MDKKLEGISRYLSQQVNCLHLAPVLDADHFLHLAVVVLIGLADGLFEAAAGTRLGRNETVETHWQLRLDCVDKVQAERHGQEFSDNR